MVWAPLWLGLTGWGTEFFAAWNRRSSECTPYSLYPLPVPLPPSLIALCADVAERGEMDPTVLAGFGLQHAAHMQPSPCSTVARSFPLLLWTAKAPRDWSLPFKFFVRFGAFVIFVYSDGGSIYRIYLHKFWFIYMDYGVSYTGKNYSSRQSDRLSLILVLHFRVRTNVTKRS